MSKGFVDNYRQIEKEILLQMNNGIPESTGEKTTLGEFLDKYRGQIHEGITTVCDPPLHDYTVDIESNKRLWFRIPFDELYKNSGW